MSEKFINKTVLVTGVSNGIGRATALEFAREKAQVVIADVSTEAGEETAHTISQNGGEALFVKTDVSKSGEVESLIKKIVGRYGRLDCAFNNAGIEGEQALTADTTEANWDRVISINLKGIWLCMKYEIPQMLLQKSGAIVNMSSVAGLVGFQGIPAYTASKHGILGLTKTAALEYATRGIRVNAVCPGVIQTEMIERLTKGDKAAEASLLSMEPIGRLGRPQEIAHAVLWLCSEGASFVTGQALAVDGGFVAQ